MTHELPGRRPAVFGLPRSRFRLLNALAARETIGGKHGAAFPWTSAVIAVVSGVDTPFTTPPVRGKHHHTSLAMGKTDLLQNRGDHGRMAAASRVTGIRVDCDTERQKDYRNTDSKDPLE